VNEHERMEQLLKQAMQPIQAELARDLWPAMLTRLEAKPAPLSWFGIPWFDWALLVAVAALLIFSPGAIPVLLYHL
jgi:hypothetical protein